MCRPRLAPRRTLFSVGALELEEPTAAELAAAPRSDVPADRPVALFCAEYGIHPSLRSTPAASACWPASDARLPMVAIGLLFREGEVDVDAALA